MIKQTDLWKILSLRMKHETDGRKKTDEHKTNLIQLSFFAISDIGESL